MHVYITKINGIPSKNNKQFLQQMTTDIAHRLGIKEMGIYCYFDMNESAESLNARIDGIIAGISSGDLIICQLPTGNGMKFERELINHLKAYGGRIAIFLYELEPLLYEEKRYMLLDIINLYNQAEILIVPSLAMRQFLLDNNIRKDMKFVIQEMWDYSYDMHFSHSPVFKKEIAFIGDNAFEGMSDWKFELSLKLYGYTGNADVKQNVHIINNLTQSEVIYELSKGGFGLIWYKNMREREYMEYGVSSSLGQYLAAGIPVIVPAGISSQKLIEKNHLGLAVHSIDEAIEKVKSMDEAEDQEYVRCVEQFAPALRNGYFTEKCLIETTQAFYRKDVGMLEIPERIYGLDNSTFSLVVLKESYKENLALSWDYKGNADGFLIYNDNGLLVYETDNVYQHYHLIKNNGKESGFIIKAYLETLKGKLIIAESEMIYLNKECDKDRKVSLLISAYNSESYIARSIDTALAQSFQDLEIVIVDDGSTDNTGKIIDWYAERYPNVVGIHQKNGGTPTGRNTGIAYANGDYIGFLDSDDMIRPNMIMRLYGSIQKNQCDIAVTSTYLITNEGYKEFIQYPMEKDAAMKIDDFFKMHFTKGCMFATIVCNKLYRTALIKQRLFPVIPIEDEAWTPYILSYADTICYLDDRSYEYDRLIRNDSISDKLLMKSNHEMFAIHKKTIMFYLEKGNPKKLALLKQLSQRQLTEMRNAYAYEEYGKLWDHINQTFT